MGGIISFFRGWRADGRSYENLLAKSSSDEQQQETALTNPVFDFSYSSRLSSNVDENQSNVEDQEQPKRKQGPLFTARTVQVTLLESGDRYEEINSIVSNVLQLYKPIEVRKEGIRKTLVGFKEALGLYETAAIPGCFKVLREKFSSTTQLELICAGTEPIKMKINDFSTPSDHLKAVDEGAKKAITLLNACLNHCQKFTGEKELKLVDIEVRLEDLQLMPLTKEGQLLYAAVNEIPSYIEELSLDIGVLLQDIYKAQPILRPQ
ncbi:PREDICTED: uncharacterized protein LOC100640510 [Amphimedon queenslandica]|nr:PREDICTED: uncharacterized protein LOC100640510 [Amphimedon queenslandica]|eukprot:XP_003389578.1 PREDICTED: uncharacterized protein LOC100640510 [Amphimedon queenslandica]